MNLSVRFLGLILAGTLLVVGRAARAAENPPNYVAGTLVELNDNGAWSWFMDPRAIVLDGKLIVGSVRAIGNANQGRRDPNGGNVEVAVYDIATGKVGTTILHQHYEQDDHDAPAFLPLADGRLLALYTKHGVEAKVNWRFSEPGNPLAWGEANEFITPRAGAGQDFRGDVVTYSNPFLLPDGRILNFFRGPDLDPNYIVSADSGKTWTYGGRLLRGRDGYSPYLKYAYDGRGTIHFVTTEDHPRNFDNSIYHGFIRDGVVHSSDGKPAGKLSESTDAQIAAWDLTKVVAGDADNVAWMVDLELDAQGRPCLVYSVQKDGRGLPQRRGGMDLRYGYARWDGTAWHAGEVAHAGRRLYAGEDDYAGLAALDPRDPEVMFISTDADPVTGEPLVSTADQRRHYELYRGTSSNGGKTWSWQPLTANSTVDNLRPLVPDWDDPRTALVWMRGAYRAYGGEWTTAVVAMILPAGR